jgi:uroporphyrinogen III methyltransferase/synthase
VNVPAADRPLAGRTVVVTRAAAQASDLVAHLEELGAEVLALPVIEIVDPADIGPLQTAIELLAAYDWVVLSSVNAADRFFERVTLSGRGGKILSHVKFAAVGSATAACVRSYGAEPDLVPDDFSAEGLVEAFRAAGAGPGWRVLVPRAAEGREVLRDGLEAMGCEVDVVAAYRTVAAKPEAAAVARLRAGVDAVTFTSPSTVRHFVAVLESGGIDAGTFMREVVKASIGPVTRSALDGMGYGADVEADPYTAEALAAALGRHFLGS